MAIGHLFKVFHCADGRGIFIQFYKSFTRRFLKLLGINDQLNREGFTIDSAWESGIDNNVYNAVFGGSLSEPRKKRLYELISQALLSKPAEEWETLVQNAGGFAAVVRTRGEWLALQAHLASGSHPALQGPWQELACAAPAYGVRRPRGQGCPLQSSVGRPSL